MLTMEEMQAIQINDLEHTNAQLTAQLELQRLEREAALRALRGQPVTSETSELVELAADRFHLMQAYHESREVYKRAWLVQTPTQDERREIESALQLLALYASGWAISFDNGVGLYDPRKPIALVNLLAGGWDRVATYLLELQAKAVRP